MLYVNVIRKNYNGFLYIWGGGGCYYIVILYVIIKIYIDVFRIFRYFNQ